MEKIFCPCCLLILRENISNLGGQRGNLGRDELKRKTKGFRTTTAERDSLKEN